ncbi:MAG: nuclear transport factor 2 family protein [Mycobacteriales bacterium]
MADSESNTDRMRRAYAAFSAGDLSTLSELMSPECTWIAAGDNALAGTYLGRDATFGYFGKLMDATEGTFLIELQDVTEIQHDLVLACCHVKAGARGKAYEADIIQRFVIEDGQAIECRTYVEDSTLWDAFIGPAVITLPAGERAGTGALG